MKTQSNTMKTQIRNTIVDAETKSFLASLIIENKEVIAESFRTLEPYKMLSVVAKILPYIATKEVIQKQKNDEKESIICNAYELADEKPMIEEDINSAVDEDVVEEKDDNADGDGTMVDDENTDLSDNIDDSELEEVTCFLKDEENADYSEQEEAACSSNDEVQEQAETTSQPRSKKKGVGKKKKKRRR